MRKPKSPYYLAGAAVTFFLAIGFTCIAAVSGNGNPEDVNPGIVTIDIPQVEDHDKMPAVQFFHGRHTKAVEKDCSLCHKDKEGKPVFKFQRLEDPDPEAAMALYHEKCVACHVDRKNQGSSSGPMAGECRVCHNTDPELSPSGKAVEFDRSLHFRHSESGEIKAMSDEKEQNCGVCHHQYDEEKEKLYYEKGTEGACIYCHEKTGTEEVRSIRSASHDSCVACHQTLRKKGVEKTGPVMCAACHGENAFSDIKTVEEVPRIKRNQPDTLFITGWGAMDLSAEKRTEIENDFMNPVAFDHKSHETNTDSCKTCHHASLEKCGSCHTPRGDEKGDHVRLDQAMHAEDSDRSCLGCHNSRKKAAECAGCHFTMTRNEAADGSCQKCHYTDMKAGEMALLDEETRKTMARRTLEELSSQFEPVASSDIPEKVTIGVISDAYEPSEFPHRKIVAAITEKIKDSDMARVFHGDGRTLCSGCHHNSPRSLTPPKCASCHGKSTFAQNGRPGLKGAYHGQCITCHQQMEIEKVAANDCVKCHKEKKQK